MQHEAASTSLFFSGHIPTQNLWSCTYICLISPFPGWLPFKVWDRVSAQSVFGVSPCLMSPLRTVVNGPAHLPPDSETGWHRLCSVHLLSLVQAKCLAYSKRSENISKKRINAWKMRKFSYVKTVILLQLIHQYNAFLTHVLKMF